MDKTIELKVKVENSGTGPGGSWHAFNDRLKFVVVNRVYGRSQYLTMRDGERLPVEIGGVETTMIEVPEDEAYGERQFVDIPVTVKSGTHTVTVDGVDIGQIEVYNPDYPPESKSTEPDVPGTTDSDQTDQAAASTPTADSESTGQSDSQQSETTGQSDSEQQGSRVTTKTVAAAGIAALALLIWVR
ncbi:hypothetical protein [Haloarcula sebkhae]|uniref:Uncharacterized protein n=1 Tax=Haloarcula sebkhae TaxID=932660 RepID=A0ACC6VQE8_9EURY|nr:hypothetical protein [Haloarcula sebkhae]